jgi:hypothetical protein
MLAYADDPMLFCGCAVLQVLVDEGLAERAEHLGRIFRDALKQIPSERVKEVRGRGMLNALVIREKDGVSAWEVCLKLRDNGLLTKPTHGDTIRWVDVTSTMVKLHHHGGDGVSLCYTTLQAWLKHISTPPMGQHTPAHPKHTPSHSC